MPARPVFPTIVRYGHWSGLKGLFDMKEPGYTLRSDPEIEKEFFLDGDDPFLSKYPELRVKLAQLANAYKSALSTGDIALAERIKAEAHQIRAEKMFDQN